MDSLDSPRFEEFGPLLIAGLRESYTDATSTAIPAQWQRFEPFLGQVPGQVGGVAYGLVYPSAPPDEWDYVCGVQISDAAQLPPALTSFTIPKQKYAVFSHTGYLATLRETWQYIWCKWLPQSGLRIAPTARIEWYSESFRPKAPGGIELLIPIQC